MTRTMRVPFDLELATAPVSYDLESVAAGTGALTVTLDGLLPGDTVQQGALAFVPSVGATITKEISPVANDDGQITAPSVASRQRALSFNVTAGEVAAIAAGTYTYAVRVWVLRDGVTYDREVLVGSVDAYAARVPVSGVSAVATVTVTPATANGNVGATVQLTAVAYDVDGNVLEGQAFAWSSSDSNVATVDDSGLVTYVTPGIATITAKAHGAKDTCEVTSNSAGFTGATDGNVPVYTTAGGWAPAAPSALAGLNASALASGTIPSARVAGDYTGITRVGTLTDLRVAGTAAIGDAVNLEITLYLKRASQSNGSNYSMRLDHDVSGLGSSAAIDARMTTSGTAARDHIVSFQARATHSATGAMNYLYGYTVGDTVNAGAGTVTNWFGYHAQQPAGTGTITNVYGVYVKDMGSRGTNANYAVFTEGTTPSKFGGAVTVTGNLTVAAAASIAGNLTVGSIAAEGALTVQMGSTAAATVSRTTQFLLDVASAPGFLGNALYYCRRAGATVWGFGIAEAVSGAKGAASDFGFFNGMSYVVAFSQAGRIHTAENIEVDGKIAVGGASFDSVGVRVVSTNLAGSGQYGVYSVPSFSATATGSGIGVYTKPGTAAAAFTQTFIAGFYAAAPTKGAGSTITTAYGLFIESVSAGATNYAIYTQTGTVRFGDVVQFAGTNTTGAGSATLGANCPAVTASAPYTWIQAKAADGSTVYLPAWK